MKASETQLRMLLEGQKQFRVPLFQRPFNWEEENWRTLWEDILDTYLDESGGHHFLGSVVTKSLPSTPEGISPFLIIDGQQRLTTLSILLASLSHYAKKKECKSLSGKIEDLYLKNGYASNLDIYKVLPSQDDRNAYFSIIENHSPHSDHSNVTSAYKFFQSRIQNIDKSESSFDITKLERTIVSKLVIVSISLDEGDNEYGIFESLNAKGTPLTQADLIRNYFFMRIPDSKQEYAYMKLWRPIHKNVGDKLPDFFRHILLSHGHFVRKSNIYIEHRFSR